MDAEAMDADDDETTRRAIAVLTAWAATPDSTQFSQDVVSSYATDADELHELLTGMTTVAGWLLLHHARLTHRSTSQVLQHLAQSRDLNALIGQITHQPTTAVAHGQSPRQAAPGGPTNTP